MLEPIAILHWRFRPDETWYCSPCADVSKLAFHVGISRDQGERFYIEWLDTTNGRELIEVTQGEARE